MRQRPRRVFCVSFVSFTNTRKDIPVSLLSLSTMNNFKRGDILRGTRQSFNEAYHPVVFIDGPEFAPFAVILTHKDDHPCNFKLSGTYDGKPQYVVAHLIEKLAEWGPYQKKRETYRRRYQDCRWTHIRSIPHHMAEVPRLPKVRLFRASLRTGRLETRGSS